MSDAVRDAIVVDADPDAVLDEIVDYESYPSWQPEFEEAEILETDEHGWGTRVRFVVDMSLFTSEYVLGYEYTDTTVSWHLVSSEQLEQLDGAYELTDLGDGRTEVAYRLEVGLRVRVPGALRRRAAKRIVDGALRQLKDRVESQVGGSSA